MELEIRRRQKLNLGVFLLGSVVFIIAIYIELETIIGTFFLEKNRASMSICKFHCHCGVWIALLNL